VRSVVIVTLRGTGADVCRVKGTLEQWREDCEPNTPGALSTNTANRTLELRRLQTPCT